MKEIKEPISQKLERPPALDRIVSEKLTEEERRELILYFKSVFEKQELDELKTREIKLSDEEEYLAQKGNQLTTEALERYGIRAMSVSTKNVHILNDEQYRRLGERHEVSLKKAEAITSPYDQAILIRETQRSRFDFFSLVIHEMFHLKSFISMHRVKVSREEAERLGVVEISETESGPDEDFIIVSRRLGWNVEKISRTEGAPGYFRDIDEALTELLTVKIIREEGAEVFGREFEVSEKLRRALISYINEVLANARLGLEERAMLENRLKWLEDDVLFLPSSGKIWEKYENARENNRSSVLLGALKYYSDEGFEEADQFHYSKQRETFKKLIEELYDRNKIDFDSEDDVLALFIKGGFDGNIMPVARLVEKTFGKGSFRELGEGKRLI